MSKERQILDAARRVFRDKGYYAASMQEIAHAVGLQKGSLYYYISGKQELLFRIFDEAIGSMIAQLESIRAMAVSPGERLRRAITAHTVAIADHPDTLGIVLRETRVLSPSQRDRIDDQRRHYERLLESILIEGIKAGQFREMDPRLITYALLGMTNWVHRWYNPSGRLSAEEIAAIFSDVLLHGITAEGEAANS
ncbi:MAG TPA: TetR/AcrR family transcriptional regulator [Clostridiales bacterium]|nr:TetR/AcrR family transcriptional regulator [Clostridiales bacterium]